MLYFFSHKSLLLVFTIFSFLATGSSLADLQKESSTIQIVTFNVLAPCYASPSLYPAGSVLFLEKNRRRERIIGFLNSVSANTDIIALQETTQTEFQYFKSAFEKDFYGFEVYHDAKYWTDWRLPDLAWEPNGVAIFVRKNSFKDVKFNDLALSDGGNHSAYFEGIHQSTSLKIRAASIHLDSDRDVNRHRELKSLLNYFTPDSTTRDIIAGDFNYGTHNGVIKLYLRKNKFIDVLYKLDREEWTSPYSDDWYRSRNNGIIDHVVVRNARPRDGQVFNFGLWDLYPTNQDQRILAALEQIGSDHFPVLSVIDLK